VNDSKLAGRAAFVTGGAGGIGLGIARALLADGARVVLADLDPQGLELAAATLDGGDRVVTLELDVRDRDGWVAAADAAEAALGPVSILCNNAGVASASDATDNLSYDVWDLVIGIDLGGVINGVQTFVPRMLGRGGGGHVVNTASGAGLAVTGRGTGYAYHTAKYAVVGLSEALHAQLGPAGIGVSVLCPGAVATRVFENTDRVGAALGVAKPTKATKIAAAAGQRFVARGLDPDVVGVMVRDAICRGDLFVLTDSMMSDAVSDRTRAILAAVPRA
jgi:NAD(P)-dependent dehydrogenase (short-subunit alcohol dehydrogenase family)